MKTLIVIVALALVVIFFVMKQKPQVTQTRIKENKVPRLRPVYIDHPTAYLNEPITYTEWDQEISSSL